MLPILFIVNMSFPVTNPHHNWQARLTLEPHTKWTARQEATEGMEKKVSLALLHLKDPAGQAGGKGDSTPMKLL
jgi:hypothetical protein